MRYTVRPISDRTPFTGKHQRSPFDSPWSRTKQLFLKEVRHLCGTDLVLELDVTERAIRLDGGLYANSRPATPAVRVAFDSVHGPLTYATDRFTTWQDNVRAIALGLEALRKVDRYGITKRGEQYAGWKQLPAGSGAAPSHMTRDEAGDLLYRVSGLSIYQPPEEAWRRARAVSHPDCNDGDRTVWDQVEQAAKVLGFIT